MKDRITALVLAAGKGSRMGIKERKQYLDLHGQPLITYALQAFEDSEADDVILVVGEGEKDYVKKNIVEPYGFHKVRQIIIGGKERYESVYNGLCAAVKMASDHANTAVDSESADIVKVVRPGESVEHKDVSETGNHYVLIHDGARPFLTPEKISDCIRAVQETKACVMGMPVKDTIKIVDENDFAVSTPLRSTVWQMQTPQCFDLYEIQEAYQKLMDSGVTRMTDDAMVMEEFGTRRVKMIPGGYENIKITTPEDLILGEAMMSNSSF